MFTLPYVWEAAAKVHWEIFCTKEVVWEWQGRECKWIICFNSENLLSWLFCWTLFTINIISIFVTFISVSLAINLASTFIQLHNPTAVKERRRSISACYHHNNQQWCCQVWSHHRTSVYHWTLYDVAAVVTLVRVRLLYTLVDTNP